MESSVLKVRFSFYLVKNCSPIKEADIEVIDAMRGSVVGMGITEIKGRCP